MASAAAERQRRRRAHVKGDHSLCLPANCEDAAQERAAGMAPADTSSPADEEPVASDLLVDARRGPRGERLWQEMMGANLPRSHWVLLDEACRLADRLDRLDAILERRSDWVHLVELPESTSTEVTVRVVVTGALSEARQQASVFKSAISELRAVLPKARPMGKHRAGTTTSGTGTSAAATTGTGGNVVGLASRAAKRRRQAGQ